MEHEPTIKSVSDDISSDPTLDHDDHIAIGRADESEAQWYETRTPEQATSLFREELKRKPSIYETPEDNIRRLFRSWLEFYVVSLLSGPTLVPAQALVALLQRMEKQGRYLGAMLPQQALVSTAVALHRGVICMAEFPSINRVEIEAGRSALDLIYARSSLKPVASSITRLALIPRLGLVATGEADFLLVRDTHRELKAEAASKAKSRESSQGTRDDDETEGTEPTGPTCSDAWLGFMVEWLILNNRNREAVDLIEHEFEPGGDLCSLCGLGPQVSLSVGLLPAIDLGRQDLALLWLGKLETITPLNPRWLFAAGHRAHALARLGEIEEARELVGSAAPYAEDTRLSAWNRLWFHHHAASTLYLASTDSAAAEFHRREARSLAIAFDIRNGNREIEARLDSLT